MPEGAREEPQGDVQAARIREKKAKARRSCRSGAILNEGGQARNHGRKYDVAADVWSVTSYPELYRDGQAAERWNWLHPGAKPRVAYVTQCLGDTEGVIVAASDYVKILPGAIDRWAPRRVTALGTDGFGRSEGRRPARFLRGAQNTSSPPSDVSRRRRIEWRGQKASGSGLNAEKPIPPY